MTSRQNKIQLLDSAFNQGNYDSLKLLSRPNYSNVLIFEPKGTGTLFNARLNPKLPPRYQGKSMDNQELDTMLFDSGNLTTFLIPDNGRD